MFLKLSFIRHIVSCQLLHFVRVVSPHPIALQDIGNSTRKDVTRLRLIALSDPLQRFCCQGVSTCWGGFGGCCFGPVAWLFRQVARLGIPAAPDGR